MPRPLAVLAVLFAVVIAGSAALLYQADRNAVLKLARGSSPAAVELAPPTEIAAPETPTVEQEPESQGSEPARSPAEGTVAAAPAADEAETTDPLRAGADAPTAGGKNWYFGEPKPEPEVEVAAPAEPSAPAAPAAAEEQVAATEPEMDSVPSGASAPPSAGATEGGAPIEPPAGEPSVAVADASATSETEAKMGQAAPVVVEESAAPQEMAGVASAESAPTTGSEPASPLQSDAAGREAAVESPPVAATTEGMRATAELHVEAAPQTGGSEAAETETETAAVEPAPRALEGQSSAKAESDAAGEIEPAEAGSGGEELEVASAGPSATPATGGKEAEGTPLPQPDQAAAGGGVTPQTEEDEPTPQAEEPPDEPKMAGAGERQPMGSVQAGEATTSTLGAAAEAGAVELSGPLVAGGEARTEELRIAAAAPSGIPDAMDVTIKAAEAETGTLYVAGQAPAGALLNVYADGELVGEARAGTDGVWLLEAQKEVPAGQVVLRVEAVFEDSPGPTAVAEMPFVRHPEGVVLEPSVTAMGGEGGLVRVSANPPPPSYVIIRRGDNLWRIARRNYGRGIRYETIFAANRDRIRNPHRIFPGQVFVIPTSDRSWPSASN